MSEDWTFSSNEAAELFRNGAVAMRELMLRQIKESVPIDLIWNDAWGEHPGAKDVAREMEAEMQYVNSQLRPDRGGTGRNWIEDSTSRDKIIARLVSDGITPVTTDAERISAGNRRVIACNEEDITAVGLYIDALIRADVNVPSAVRAAVKRFNAV